MAVAGNSVANSKNKPLKQTPLPLSRGLKFRADTGVVMATTYLITSISVNQSDMTAIKMEEEFNNFMHRVTEVNGIVKKLSANDPQLNKMGEKEADLYLNESHLNISDTIDDETIELRIRDDKTVINKVRSEDKDEANQSQAAFKKEIERDAQQRYDNKKVRQEKSETLKIQANKAFRRAEYEKALSLYTKSIEHIRDSCVLYTNRALTYIQLEFYERALADCETAQKLNENSLKSWLYKAKCYFMLNDVEKSEECVEEAIKRHPAERKMVNEFVNNYTTQMFKRK